MTHLDDLTLYRLVDREIDPDNELVVDHLAGCEECQHRLGHLTDEAHLWQAALELTPQEQEHLAGARLSERLTLTIARQQQASRHHLFLVWLSPFLLGSIWWLLAEPSSQLLVWLDRMISLPGIAIGIAIGLVDFFARLLGALQALPMLAQDAFELGLLVCLFGIGLWLIRPIAAGRTTNPA